MYSSEFKSIRIDLVMQDWLFKDIHVVILEALAMLANVPLNCVYINYIVSKYYQHQ